MKASSVKADNFICDLSECVKLQSRLFDAQSTLKV